MGAETPDRPEMPENPETPVPEMPGMPEMPMNSDRPAREVISAREWIPDKDPSSCEIPDMGPRSPCAREVVIATAAAATDNLFNLVRMGAEMSLFTPFLALFSVFGVVWGKIAVDLSVLNVSSFLFLSLSVSMWSP